MNGEHKEELAEIRQRVEEISEESDLPTHVTNTQIGDFAMVGIKVQMEE